MDDGATGEQHAVGAHQIGAQLAVGIDHGDIGVGLIHQAAFHVLDVADEDLEAADLGLFHAGVTDPDDTAFAHRWPPFPCA